MPETQTLVPDEPEIKIQKEPKKKSVSLLKLFKYASWKELICLFFGIIGAIGVGILIPMLMFVFALVVDSFSDPFNPSDFSSEGLSNQTIIDSFVSNVNSICLQMIYFGIGNLIAAIFMTLGFYLFSNLYGMRLRQLYLSSLLRQDMEWYDSHNIGELTSKVISQTQQIQDAVSNKLGILIQMVASLITSIALGFVFSWDLSLVILSLSPFIIISAGFIGCSCGILSSKSQTPKGFANSIAEETLGNIRTIKSLGVEEMFSEEYNSFNQKVTKYLSIMGHCIGLGVGSTSFITFCSFVLAFWYGSLAIRGLGGNKSGISPGECFVVIMSINNVTENLSNLGIPLGVVASGKAAATEIFETIDRKPTIDSRNSNGRNVTISGAIEFKEVKFEYPTRPDQEVLSGLNLKIEPGKTVALVGESGCGKSTITQLLERFYDPTSGEIMVDEVNIKDLNLSSLRNQIGYVGQEPVLFGTTVLENIQLGGLGFDNITKVEIEEAAKKANAHSFIISMPEGYETKVGDKGSQLSGGQKQRIAIARALIRDPKILILDEATSALDSQSEKKVQEALDKAREGRTTIVIAHRLSTIQNADKICVIDKGKIVEEGTHQELMDLNGKYASMVVQQNLGITKEIINEEISSEDISDKVVIQTKEETIEKEKNGFIVSLKVMFNNVKNEWVSSLIGIIGSIGIGTLFPIYSIVMIDLFVILMQLSPGIDITEEQSHSLLMKYIYMLIIGFVAFLSFYFYIGVYEHGSAKMVGRFRSKYYSSLLHQDIEWFDISNNRLGTLTAQLQNSPQSLSGISGGRLGQVLMVLSNSIVSLFIAFYFQWKLALCVVVIFPIYGILLFADGKLNSMNAEPLSESFEDANGVLVDAIESIRTVQSLGAEERFNFVFKTKLRKPIAAMKKYGPLLSSINGSVNCLMYAVSSFTWYLGVYFLKNSLDVNTSTNQFMNDFVNSFGDIQKVLLAIVFAAQTLGQIGTFSPDISKGVNAAKKIFSVLERKQKIVSKELCHSLLLNGTIEFKEVKFEYPTRPDQEVLSGLNLKIEPGKTVALVGESGCGKSTITQLLERFYDPTSGEIMVDEVNIKDLNLSSLRNQIGYVGQEPVLFSESIMNNIKRGNINASNDQLFEISKFSGCDFIDSLPEGYETKVGDKGSQLSGGQKQRIAIARALIRDPKILILDEATSALDSQSEKKVQEALDKAREGRTTIVIAHRLSTIQNADKICVIDKGKIVEEGTHQELMDLNGKYASMIAHQSSGTP